MSSAREQSNPGQITSAISIPVLVDTEIEADETFKVELGFPLNGTPGKNEGIGTIINDDSEATLPRISISNASIIEGNGGASNAVFTVSLSAPSPQEVTVGYQTSNGTATSESSDFQAVSDGVVFAPFVTTQFIMVPVNGDTVVEANETFAVKLSGAYNALIGVASGTGTIINDDAAPPPAPAPQIFLFSPSSGLRGSGTIIAGVNFTGVTSVKFNGVTAKFIILSPTQIKATIPLTATTGKISITTLAGTGTSSSNYTVIPPPTFTSFTPASGPVRTLVTVSGKNFDGASIVKVNGRIVPFQLLTGAKLRLTITNGITSGKSSVSTQPELRPALAALWSHLRSTTSHRLLAQSAQASSSTASTSQVLRASNSMVLPQPSSRSTRPSASQQLFQPEPPRARSAWLVPPT